MDCPSEEQLVRLALEDDAAVVSLAFDLPGRSLEVWHHGEAEPVARRLESLNLGSRLESSGPALKIPPTTAGEAPAGQARTLWIVLAINAVMFVVELSAGWLAESTGLLADSLDMLADASVYALSLYAVGHSAAMRLRAARLCGVLQLTLALGALGEVVRRTLTGSAPEPAAMMGVALLALAANVTCLVLLARHRDGGAHMTASYICSANDVIANVGVILAGALVAWTGSRVPDLLIGTAVAAVVMIGAIRILRLR
jgi:Co/Zn/Cd efflux system component